MRAHTSHDDTYKMLVEGDVDAKSVPFGIIRHMGWRHAENVLFAAIVMDEQLCSGAAVGRRGIVRAVGRSPQSGDGGALRLKCSEELGGDRRRRSPLR